MRIRALFLLSILTFGCLSEAQPTPGGIKDSLTLAVVALRAVAQLYLRQNTRTILQQEVSSAARAMMPRSPFHHAGPVHSSVMAHLQPPVIRTGIGALLQARPVHTSTTTLLASSRLNAASNSNQGVSDQNIQPNDDSAEPVSERDDQEYELQAILQNINERLGTNYPSIPDAIADMPDRQDVRNLLIPFSEAVEAAFCDKFIRAMNEEQRTGVPPQASNTLTPSYAELISLGVALGLSRRGQEMISMDVSPRSQELQDASSQQQIELSIDHTQVTTTVHRADDTVQISMNPRFQSRQQITIPRDHDTVQISMNPRFQSRQQLTIPNRPDMVALGTVTALSILSSIEYCELLERGQRPSRLEFAEATIARIRRHVQNDRFLHYLGIVEQNLDGSDTHGSIMSQLNSDTSGRAAANGEWVLIDTAAALYFFLSEIQSQQALLNLVEQYTGHSELFGKILMTLSVIREGGIRRDEFTVDEIRRLLNNARINSNPDIFLVDPPADNEGGIRQDEPSVGGTRNLLDFGPE